VKPAIIPSLRYEDAPAAIDFLCDAFGFRRRAVHADPEDATIVHHAQLVRDGHMIMLSSVRVRPAATPRRSTSSSTTSMATPTRPAPPAPRS
jgi:uncharacterized glyoxalase superfamily protein PhnB